LFQVVKQWTTITDLKIYGIDDLSPDSPPFELLAHIQSLKSLSSLVLYGIGAATSIIAYTLFTTSHDHADDEPLSLSRQCFLLVVTVDEMSPNNDLTRYLLARQRHQLPCLQKLSINQRPS
jgi:hypothetical protein